MTLDLSLIGWVVTIAAASYLAIGMGAAGAAYVAKMRGMDRRYWAPGEWTDLDVLVVAVVVWPVWTWLLIRQNRRHDH